jgi:hypothetical protein
VNGQWSKQAETVKSLELPPSKTGVQSDAELNYFRLVDITGQSLPVFMASRMMDVFWGDLHMTHQGRSSKSGDSFYRPFRTA